MVSKKNMARTVVLLICILTSIFTPLVEVRGSEDAKITKVLICETVDGYGKYKERSSSIGLREVFYAYVESWIIGLPRPAGEYYFKLQFSMKIRDPLGMEAVSFRSTIIDQKTTSEKMSYSWYPKVNCSTFRNYINGEHRIIAELIDYSRNATTNLEAKFTLVGGFPNTAVFNVNQTLVLINSQSKDASVRTLRMAEIPTVNPFQTVREGPAQISNRKLIWTTAMATDT